jgi:hypothetical protein
VKSPARYSRSLCIAVLSVFLAVLSLACASARNSATTPQSAHPVSAPAASEDGTEGYATEQSSEPAPAEVRNELMASRDARVAPAKDAKSSLPATERPSKGVSTAPSDQAAKDGGRDENASKTSKGPLLIYKADVALAVFEVNKGLDAVEKIARDAQGYLVSRRDDTIVIRVPAAGFDGSLQAVLQLGDVLKRNLEVEDVTAQMNDLTTRLKNAEAMRARLEQLLTTAKTTEEALKVEEQLGRVTGTIESLKGQIRLMSELVSFSTITVTFRPTVTEKVNSKFKLPFRWLEELGLSRLMSL